MALKQPFPRIDGELWAGERRVADLVTEFGSPLYVYDAGVIEAAYRRIEAAFAGVDLLLAYSVKANSKPGDPPAAQDPRCGRGYREPGRAPPVPRRWDLSNDIVFAGVGKTEVEMEAALEAGILAFNVESAEELQVLGQVAERLGKPAPIALRVNPDIVADTPTSTHAPGTGHQVRDPGGSRPGPISVGCRPPHARNPGIDVHIGSQILEPAPYETALDQVLKLASEASAEGSTSNS